MRRAVSLLLLLLVVVGCVPSLSDDIQTARDLFEGDDPLGQLVWVNRKPCEVIGVVTELEVTDPEQRVRAKPNDTFFLPISTAIRNFYDTEPSVSITTRARCANPAW